MTQRSKKSKRQPTGDYTFGYARPPKHTKFRPGNTAAKRRKRSKPETTLDIFKRVAREKISVRVGDETVVMTQSDAVLYVNYHKALQGEDRAQANMAKFEEQTRLMQNPSEDARPGGIIAVPEPFDTHEELEAWVRKKEDEMIEAKARGASQNRPEEERIVTARRRKINTSRSGG